MKSIDWLALTRLRMARILGIVTLVVFAFACSDDSEDVAISADAAARKNKEVQNSLSSTVSEDAYCINVYNEGTYWRYTITLKEGAKGISHFILDLNNCEWNQTLSIANIVSATVNGAAANLSNSEGEGTGCVLTTDNFVKFDDLVEAEEYVIEFTLDQVFGNALMTTAWIKAGQSCIPYVVHGPCCA